MPSSTTTTSELGIPVAVEALMRLNRDIKESMRTMDPQEVRHLIKTYYAIQDFRIEAGGQVRALTEGEKPTLFLGWLKKNMESLERNIKSALDYYTDVETSGLGVWAKSIYGIGPVISAALVAYIDIEKSPYPGHIERFGGLDPQQKWLGKAGAKELIDRMVPLRTVITDELLAEIAVAAHRSTVSIANRIRKPDGTYSREELVKFLSRRPWNNDLKVIFWKIGQSFMKFSGREECFYGQYYLEQKLRYAEANVKGQYSARAEEILTTRKITDPASLEALRAGRLTEGHINAMARRKATKLFIHHYWEVAYFLRYHKAPPMPWIIAHGGHEGYIDCPYFDSVPGMREAKKEKVA